MPNSQELVSLVILVTRKFQGITKQASHSFTQKCMLRVCPPPGFVMLVPLMCPLTEVNTVHTQNLKGL